MVAGHRHRRPLDALQLGLGGLGGRGPADTMGQGLRRPDRRGERQREEGETAWAREHSDSETKEEGRIESMESPIDPS